MVIVKDIIHLYKNFISNIVIQNLNSIYIYVDHLLLYKFINSIQLITGLEANILLDIWAHDLFSKTLRFEVGYYLTSIRFNMRFFIKTRLNATQPILSLTKFFKSAGWLEREVWEFFGITFQNHPDLRRLLTDYGFKWFPLRKEFPTNGFSEIRYDELQKSIKIYKRSDLQGFRSNTITPVWVN